MANLSKSRRLFRPGDKYSYIVDNMPLENIWSAVDAINNEQNSYVQEIKSARGNTGSIDQRFAKHCSVDGRLLASAMNDPFDYNDSRVNDATKEVNSDVVIDVDGVKTNGVRNEYMQSISAHADTEYHVRMSVPERRKLAGIDDRATRTKIRVDDNREELSSGEINLRSGQAIQLQQIGQTVFVHSLLPVDLLHRHTYGERPSPYPPTTANAVSGTRSPVEIDGTVRKFVLKEAYDGGSLQVLVNGVRVDRIRIVEDDPAAGLFSFSGWVPLDELPDETNNDSLRVDYTVRFGLTGGIFTPNVTVYEKFKGYGEDLPNAVRSTWQIKSPAILQSSLHQLFLNGQHMKIRPYPFDPSDTEEYDWQFGNTDGRVDDQTIYRNSQGNLISPYVIWLNPQIDIKPTDEIQIYYQT